MSSRFPRADLSTSTRRARSRQRRQSRGAVATPLAAQTSIVVVAVEVGVLVIVAVEVLVLVERLVDGGAALGLGDLGRQLLRPDGPHQALLLLDDAVLPQLEQRL